MKITLDSTSTIERVNDTPCRLWTGHTDTGVEVHAWIATISPQTHDKAQLARFDTELKLVGARVSMRSIDLRFVI